jgi:hypothetical protein
MKTFGTILIAAAVVTLATEAMAQTMNRVSTERIPEATGFIPACPTPVPNPWWKSYNPWVRYPHYYNPYAGVLHGKANVMRAQGDRAKKLAEARMTHEHADRVEMENKVIRVQKYLEKKANGQQSRDAYHARKRAARDRYLALKREKQQAAAIPERFRNPMTGEIEWPETLQGSEFSKLRQELEQLFEQRAKTGQTAALKNQIKYTTENLTERLQGNIRELTANDYMAARRFVNTLEREAQI